jgi:TolB-like protein/DNA-binding SARP family transcriptional activator/Tfp pilus assembly protein PilF
MPDLRIRLFGPPRIERDGTAVGLGRRKAVALAAYLAAAGGSHSRDAVAALLWPENDPASARAEMRRSLSLLTTTLGRALIDADRTLVGFHGEVWVDVARFRSLLAESGTHGHGRQAACPRCLPLLKEAAELGAADFMSGFSLGECAEFESWMRGESERLRAERADVLRRLCALREQGGELPLALDAARGWLALDPLCEPAHRRLMALYAASGQRSSALRQYQDCLRTLREEAGAEPENETTELWQKIRDKRFTAAPAGMAERDAPAMVGAPAFRRPAAGLTRGRRGALLAAGVALVVLLAAGAVLLGLRRVPQSPTPIAVLPLVDTSGQAGQEWFAEGMTEAVLTELARIRGFQVTSHESVKGYAGTTKTVPVIRRELGISYLVEGSVMRVGDRVRIAIQLIDARRDIHVWAEIYERPWADILDVQKEIAADVCERVRVRLSTPEKHRLASSGHVNTAAYEASLVGEYLLANNITPDGLQRAFASFETAIAKDPGYAPAYVGLANYYWGATQFGIFPPDQGMPRAKEAAEKALSLDGSLSGAHTVLALIHFLFDWDWKAAEQEFRTAIELEPSSVEAHRWYGSLLSSQARHADAIAEVVRARDLDPLSVLNGVNVAARYYYARQYDKAIAEARTDQEMEKDFYMAPMMAGEAYAAEKDYPRAIAALRQAAELAGDWGMEPLAFLGYLYGVLGRADEARDIIKSLDAMEDKGSAIAPFLRAEPLLGLGETDKALGLLEKAYDEHDLNLVWNFQDPILDRLHGEPRFVALKKRLGL